MPHRPVVLHTLRALLPEALALAIASTVVLIILGRGPWCASVYPIDLSQAGVAGLMPTWRQDQLPCGFALRWLSNAIGGIQGEPRLSNIAFVIILIAGLGILARRDGWLRERLLLYAAALAASHRIVDHTVAWDGYFLSWCLSAMLVAKLASRARPGRLTQRRDGALLAVLLVPALSTDMITSLICGTLVMAFVLRLMLAGDYPGARRLLLTATPGSMVLALTLAPQVLAVVSNGQALAVQPGQTQLGSSILAALIDQLQGNVVLIVLAVPGLSWLLWLDRRSYRPGPDLALVLTLSLALTMVLLITLVPAYPLVTYSSLIALQPIFAMVLATCAGAILQALPLRWRLGSEVLVLIAALLTLEQHARHVLTSANSTVAMFHHQCPETPTDFAQKLGA